MLRAACFRTAQTWKHPRRVLPQAMGTEVLGQPKRTRILGFSGKHSGALKRLKAREEPSMPQRQKPTWKGYASCRIPTTRPSGKGKARAQSKEPWLPALPGQRAEVAQAKPRAL